MSGLGRNVAAAVTVLAVFAAGAGGAVGASPAFRLVFEGRHNENLWHEGPFTSSAAFCPSGYAKDVEVDDATLTSVRRFDCAGGGAFTARVASLRGEHGGTGTFVILGGSGPLADLRGAGKFTSVRLGGGEDNPASITFRSTWDGVAALDAAPPTVSVASASASKLAGRKDAWRVRAALVLDDAGGATSWRLTVSDRRKPLVPLGSKSGESPNGSIPVVLQVRVPTGTRALKLDVDGIDQVGNRASSVKLVRLR